MYRERAEDAAACCTATKEGPIYYSLLVINTTAPCRLVCFISYDGESRLTPGVLFQ